MWGGDEHVKMEEIELFNLEITFPDLSVLLISFDKYDVYLMNKKYVGETVHHNYTITQQVS